MAATPVNLLVLMPFAVQSYILQSMCLS